MTVCNEFVKVEHFASSSRRSRGCLQDLIRPSQFAHLALKLGDTLLLCSRHTWAFAAIDFGLFDPVAQRLRANPELTCHSLDRADALSSWTMRTARWRISTG